MSRNPSDTESSLLDKVTDEIEESIIKMVKSKEKVEVSNNLKDATKKEKMIIFLKERILRGHWKKHKKNSLINQFYSVRDNLSVIDDVIYMNDLCVPPYALREDVVKKVLEMGHLGETKGLNLLRQNYWWPGCSSAMKKTVRKCYECQIVTKQHNIEPMKPEMLPEGPFQKVAVDFKGPFYDGYYALVFVDLYSRWPEAYFVKSTRFNAVEKHFLRYFATYGTPLKTKSDNGPPFNGEEFNNFSKIYGFKHRKLAPKHPQANGEKKIT